MSQEFKRKGPGALNVRADSEQLGALARDFSPALAGMYRGLVKEGVPPEVAGVMASTFFARLISGRNGGE